MPDNTTICLIISAVFLISLMAAVLWLNRVQLCVLFFRLRAITVMLFLRLTRAESRLNLELEKKHVLLHRKNIELIELSKKHRELTDLVVHAKNKSVKLQRRLLRKPDSETLKSRAAEQLTLLKRLGEAHMARGFAIGDIRREINAIEASICLDAAHLRKVVQEKHGYLEESRRRFMDADIMISKGIYAHRKLVARMESRVEGLEGLIPRKGKSNPLRNAQVQLEVFERGVLEKEGKVERIPPPAIEGMSNADYELIERMMVKLDRTVEVLDHHVSAMFTVLVASDPSVENAYNRLVKQLNEARRLAECSLSEEFSLELHLNQFRSSEKETDTKEEASLSNALRRHKFNNISIDQQLFRADCIARRILILKLLLSADPGILEDEVFAYKGLLKAFSCYLEKGWSSELRTDNTDGMEEGAALLSKLSVLESTVQMSFIKLAKSKLINLSRDKFVELSNKAPDMANTIKHEIEEQKSKLVLWKKFLLDADANEAGLVQFVASQRIEQSVEVIRSLERSSEVLAIIAVCLRSPERESGTLAQ